jgi:hypothetical protein
MNNQGIELFEDNGADGFSSSDYRAMKNISNQIQNNIDNNFQDNASVHDIQKEIQNAMKIASQQMAYCSHYTKLKRGK